VARGNRSTKSTPRAASGRLDGIFFVGSPGDAREEKARNDRTVAPELPTPPACAPVVVSRKVAHFQKGGTRSQARWGYLPCRRRPRPVWISSGGIMTDAAGKCLSPRRWPGRWSGPRSWGRRRAARGNNGLGKGSPDAKPDALLPALVEAIGEHRVRTVLKRTVTPTRADPHPMDDAPGHAPSNPARAFVAAGHQGLDPDCNDRRLFVRRQRGASAFFLARQLVGQHFGNGPEAAPGRHGSSCSSKPGSPSAPPRFCSRFAILAWSAPLSVHHVCPPVNPCRCLRVRVSSAGAKGAGGAHPAAGKAASPPKSLRRDFHGLPSGFHLICGKAGTICSSNC